MPDVVVKKCSYKGWDNCIKISNGIVELICTTDIGPRIIYYGFIDGNNVFCEMKDQVGTTGGDNWKIYGGHRLWHSPEARPRCYNPDNFKIEFKEKHNGVILTQPTEPWTMIKKIIEIELFPESSMVSVSHKLINNGAWEVKLAAWALSVMTPGGREIIPQTKTNTGLLPNRMLSLWPYTKMNDPRFYWGDKYIFVDHDASVEGPAKIGTYNEDGWAAYVVDNTMFVKKFIPYSNVEYPDFAGSSFETYTCEAMVEIETLSPLRTIKPSEFVEHTEIWTLHKDIERPMSEEDVITNILPEINR